MKKVILSIKLLLATLFLTAGIATAQPHGHHHGPEGGPFKAMEELDEELRLTPEQKEEIEALKQKTLAARKEMRKTERAARTAKAEKRMAMHESLKSDLNAILTPEQTKLLEAHHEAKRVASRAVHQKVRGAMKAYHKENVEPVLRKQRQKLEAKISDEDKAVLAGIRADRKEKTGKGGRGKGMGKNADSASKREAVSALIEKYNADIEVLMKEIEPQRKQWKKDMKAIAEANRPERKGKKGKGKHRQMRGFHKARFLLMDASMAPEIENNIRN